jgi:hypothetical protein
MTHLIREVRPFWANALRCSKTLPAFLVRTSSLRCARCQANALRCSKTLSAFLSGRRYALLQAYAPIALSFGAV